MNILLTLAELKALEGETVVRERCPCLPGRNPTSGQLPPCLPASWLQSANLTSFVSELMASAFSFALNHQFEVSSILNMYNVLKLRVNQFICFSLPHSSPT